MGASKFNVLVVDNFDSFVHTLVGYLHQLQVATEVIRNNDCREDQLPERLRNYQAVLVSPGPGNPQEAGITIPIIRAAHELNKPLLGVCLGHQAMAEAFGGKVGPAKTLMHGKTSEINHTGSAIFRGIPSRFTATRYHSLAVTQMPPQLRVTARTDDEEIMALEHIDAPLYGVQFHPESVLSQWGFQLLGNWLDLAGFGSGAENSRKLTVGTVDTTR